MADKRPPRRGAGDGGRGARPSGGGGGGGGGGAGRWQARFPRPGERQDRPPRGQAGDRPERRPYERPPARDEGGWEPARGRGEFPREAPARPARQGRWEVLEADSLAELAGLLNARGVQPDHVAHLIASAHEDEEGEEVDEWEALVWVVQADRRRDDV